MLKLITLIGIPLISIISWACWQRYQTHKIAQEVRRKLAYVEDQLHMIPKGEVGWRIYNM